MSHKYEVSQVDSRLPEGTSSAVKQAVRNIYQGLSSPSLLISEPASAGRAPRTLKVSFSDSDNPKANISKYSLLEDGLARVHPGGYAALFTAALESGIPSIVLSSCWRPMLGTISHRAGLGLDVSAVGGTRLDRQELRRAFTGQSPSQKGNRNNADNVTDEEVIAFGEYEVTIKADKNAKAERMAANKALPLAKKSGNAQEITQAEVRLQKADQEVQRTAGAVEDTKAAWNDARNAGEPATTRLFRASLLECACVRQLFDPWFMESNTRDGQQPEPNMQITGNEVLHAHHLHITVDDPNIL